MVVTEMQLLNNGMTSNTEEIYKKKHLELVFVEISYSKHYSHAYKCFSDQSFGYTITNKM